MRKLTDWLLFFVLAVAVSLPVFADDDDNVIDEVVWVVGDEAIYKSEVEEQYRQMQYDGQRIDGDPYCVIPEQLAVQKLFLHQAKLDTITVPDATVFQQVEARINYLIANIGSKEKMEEYFKKPVTEIREELANIIRDQGTVQEVQRTLVKDVKITPAEVRRFYNQLPSDSIPYIPLQVEVQIITLNPKVPQQEIDNVKARLRDFSDQVNRGERDFSTLAVLYSEDRGTAMMGGEMGFVSKSNLVPEFADVAFNLNDPKKVSKIVETEYGYHIIQLIEKRGDRINVRHILLRPHVSEKDITDALERLDSLRTDLVDNKKFSFDEITQFVSQDKDTRNNKGLMVNPQTGNPKFEMGQLPQDVAKVVADMQVGDISKPFVMTDERKNKEVVAIVKLKSRIEGHKANMSDDYQTLKAIVEEKKKTEILNEWLAKKQNETYIRIKDGWRNCEFKYDGWIKN
ncbi:MULTISPECIES: peptidylprolyl isomerase [unclassified Barnesiella]|uniref:peptidylprolyl isomerase n=1 Tax=unclassified Barnesiella TaxID=2645177 RepID=UPI000B39357D|nr:MULTISPECIES: peptidylprolyl isomerase [unclassified Barnesiella]MCR8911122.1 peptidylprolyl isomerase [Barnesiella sp. ET7]OUO99627.1 peptidylprolyl isomerase [Barnesiella sp. An22]HJB73157.1 peptidylprolyl isomerase [Candidatus Barnesiella merdigallinarum]